jgi:hypothetical protein
MSLPDFLKDKEDKKKNPHHGHKGDFRQKILALLQEIKALNEERYTELNRAFHGQYDKMNIQKKRLMGFYGQLVEELRRLRDHAGITIQKTTEKIVKKIPVKEAQQAVEKAVDKARDLLNKPAAKKKVAKKATKAPAKKAPAKAAVKKKAAAPTAAKKKVAKKKTKR